MRIMTVRQPWAWAIVHAGKDVENRSRNIAGDYRGEVAIHAGKARFEDDGDMWEVRRAITSEINGWPATDSDVWAADMVEPTDPRFVYGAVIGVVDLVDVHPCRGQGLATEPIGGCTPWADYGEMHHLVLANPRALATPIPATGRLGLWRPDVDLVADIASQFFDLAEGGA